MADEGSDFAAVLDGIAHEEAERPGLAPHFEVCLPPGAPKSLASPLSGRCAYEENSGRAEDVGWARASSLPPPASRETPEAAIDPDRLRRLSAEELRALRRRFAAANHPDALPAHLKHEAEARMARANALIDAALKGR